MRENLYSIIYCKTSTIQSLMAFRRPMNFYFYISRNDLHASEVQTREEYSLRNWGKILFDFAKYSHPSVSNAKIKKAFEYSRLYMRIFDSELYLLTANIRTLTNIESSKQKLFSIRSMSHFIQFKNPVLFNR